MDVNLDRLEVFKYLRTRLDKGIIDVHAVGFLLIHLPKDLE